MSRARVTVVDYGIGNLYSVQRALERCGAEVLLASDPDRIEAAERLFLPGVGAFADGMQGLKDRDLVMPLQEYAASGRPFLGVCLGMQMLASVSEEFGTHAGLGLISGRVVPIPATATDGRKHKIPHIGWSPLDAAGDWGGTLLDGTAPGTAVYLVHSYQFVPEDREHLLATCEYGGHPITAAVKRGSVVGCQFHPEKSGPAGLRMLETWLGVGTR